MIAPILTTERVVLRQLTAADAAHLFALDHDPGVLQFTSEVPRTSVAAYRDLIATEIVPFYRRSDQFGHWGAEERNGGPFLGWFCLHPAADSGVGPEVFDFAADDCEIGYRLRRHAWGRGLATEVARSLIDRAFVAWVGCRVVATTRSDNIASIRVLEKAGMGRHPEPRAVSWSEIPYLKFELTREGRHAGRD